MEKKMKKVCLVLVGVLAVLSCQSIVNAQENKSSSSANLDKKNTAKIKTEFINHTSPLRKSPRGYSDIDEMCNEITKRLFKTRFEYYINKAIRDGNYVLGPKKGDKIVLENVLPITQRNVRVGEQNFDLQPNITIWGTQWYGLSRDEVPGTNFTDNSMAVESRYDSDATYYDISINSGSAEQRDIEISGNNQTITITRTADVTDTTSGSSGQVAISSAFDNNYGTASNSGTEFSGPNSDWYTSDASTNSFRANLTLSLYFPMISVFDATVKNDAKNLDYGTTFSESPEDFYTITKQPDNSTTTATWKTKPDMTKAGDQTAMLLVTNTASGYQQTKEVSVHFKIVGKLELSVPQNMSFKDVRLGDNDMTSSWQSASAVKVVDTANQGWDLSIKLGENSETMLGYLLYHGQVVSNENDTIIHTASGDSDITPILSGKQGLLVDYSKATKVMENKGSIIWTLSASTKGVTE